MRHVVFNPDEALCEYTSASYHLQGAYVDFFPCPNVEVFHFPNVYEPSICATVTFVMPAE